MKRKLAIITFIYACLWGVIFPYAAHAEIRDLPSVTVLAPVGMTEPLAEIVRLYSRERGVSVFVSYDVTRQHFQEVVDGEAADVFITDDLELMRDLKNRGLIDVYAQTALMRNPLVLVASAVAKQDDLGVTAVPDVTGDLIRQMPARSPYQQEGVLPWLNDGRGGDTRRLLDYTRHMRNKQLLKDHAKLRSTLLHRPLFIANTEQTTAGKLTHVALQALFIPLTGAAEPGIKADSRQVLRAVAARPQALGVAHRSDAERAIAEGQAISIVAEFPAVLYQPPAYQALVVAGENMARGRDFVEFLRGEDAGVVFERGYLGVQTE